MNFIPMSILEYNFDDAGVTEQIVVAFQHYQGNEQFNARVSLTQEYVEGINDKVTLDRMNKAQIESFARVKLRDWILTDRPEEEAPAEEETPVEE